MHILGQCLAPYGLDENDLPLSVRRKVIPRHRRVVLLSQPGGHNRRRRSITPALGRWASHAQVHVIDRWGWPAVPNPGAATSLVRLLLDRSRILVADLSRGSDMEVMTDIAMAYARGIPVISYLPHGQTLPDLRGVLHCSSFVLGSFSEVTAKIDDILNQNDW